MNPQLAQCKFSILLLSLLDLSATAAIKPHSLFLCYFFSIALEREKKKKVVYLTKHVIKYQLSKNCIDSNGEKMNLRSLGFTVNIVQYSCK